jgi:hypothetical protein
MTIPFNRRILIGHALLALPRSLVDLFERYGFIESHLPSCFAAGVISGSRRRCLLLLSLGCGFALPHTACFRLPK